MSSSSSSVSTTALSSGHLRITGLSSGIDVDSIVERSMSAEKTKLNKLKQQDQLVTWKQEAYRSIITAVNEFADKYFNLTSSSSILTQGNFKKYTTASSDDAITVSACSSAVTGTHSLTVSQLATAGVQTGSSRLSKDIQGTEDADFTSAQGKSFIITIDGTERTVTLDSTVTDVDSLQDAVDNAVGAGKLVVSTDSETAALVFKAADDSGVSTVTLSSGTSDGLDALGFGSGSIYSNRIDTSDSLESLASQLNTTLTFNDDGELEMTINGTTITADKSESLDDLIERVNESDLGVTLGYDEIADKMVLTSDELGAGKTIELTESGGNFLEAALDQFVEGTDAKFTIDGVSLTRSSNDFTLDGITYSFNDTTAKTAKVTISQDTDGIYKNITNFVNDYNTLMDTINGVISEEYDYDYPPLTSDQKAKMDDNEIEAWEKKAKTGILANDSLLQDMLDGFRSALVERIDGLSTSIYSIGISPSNDYHDKGKLEIDETELKAAIEADPEAIMKLFTQQSEDYSGTTTVRTLSSSARATRYQEEGLAYRFYDIIQDYVGTLRDSAGNKGLLLEKAGMEDDSTETDNAITKQLEDYAKRIEAEEDRLDNYENSLYSKYTRLETYMSNMNTQLNALLSMFKSKS